jgi:VanZ family protein
MWQGFPVIAQQARPTRPHLWRWLWVGGAAAGLFALSSVPGTRLPVAPETRLARRWHGTRPRWQLSDKVLHALAFGLGTVLLCRALRRQVPTWSLRQIACVSFLAACGYGIVDELHQARVPQRTAEVADVVADGLGAALAAWGWRHYVR